MTEMQRILHMLATLEKRIAALEALSSSIRSPKKANPPDKKKSLTDYILELREVDFFISPQTGNEVHAKLQKTYPCLKNRVHVALIRLSDAKQLRKAEKIVDGEKCKAFVW